MTLKAQTTARALLAWMQTVQPIANECVIEQDKDGLVTRMVDPANSVMVEMHIPIDMFSEISIDGKVGIDVTKMIERLKTFSPEATLNILAENGKILLDAENMHYKIGEIDPSTIRKSNAMPNLDLPSQFTIDARLLQGEVKRASLARDHVLIRMDKKQVTMLAVGDGDEYEGDLTFNNNAIIDKHADVASLFSLDYLVDIVKVMDGEVTVHLGRDLPVMMTFDRYGATVTYLLAPRIGDE